MRRSPKPARTSTYRPPAPSTHNMASPPSSPSLAASISDDEHLEGSFLLVSVEEDETSSTIGSSLRDSVIGDLLSDSSEEPAGREGWDGSTDGGESDHHSSLSITGGSYIDAEATATAVTSSMGPLEESTSSSQVRLIMPALEASGITSESTTPSESLVNLLAIPDVKRPPPSAAQIHQRRGSSPSGRGVEASWLEASSRLWNIPPEMDSLLSEAGEYKLLASMDDIVEEKEPGYLGEKAAVGTEFAKVFMGDEKKQDQATTAHHELRRALVAADLAGRRMAKKW